MADQSAYEPIKRQAADLRARAMRLLAAVQAFYLKGRLSVAIADLDEIDSLVLRHADTASTLNSQTIWLHAAKWRLRTAEATVFGVQDVVDKSTSSDTTSKPSTSSQEQGKRSR